MTRRPMRAAGRRLRICIVWTGAALGGLTGVLLGGLPHPALGSVPCERILHAGTAFTICRVDTKSATLDLFWRDRTGKVFGSFPVLAKDLQRKGQQLLFAMNAGMYHPDLSPVGLYVENGRKLVPASTRDGPGNFHLKPNGIFFVTDDGAGVLETGAYLQRRPKARIATQSGPMLVIDGKLHPRFLKNGTSRKVRNGVGVCTGGEVVFALSEGRTNFFDFGTLFLDRLGCRNALYLDGTISGLHAPSIGRSDVGWPYGPIIAVTAPTEKSAAPSEP